MATPFDPGADFAAIAADLDFPGTATVRRIDADTGATITEIASVAAAGRTTDATPAGVGEGGEIFPRGKRWLFDVADITWTLTRRDHVVSDGGVYEIESVSLIAFSTIYRVESHYLGAA